MTTTGKHSERVRDYFDAHAEDWSQAYRRRRSANDVVLAERLRLALELTADAAEDSSVLDAGCGAGPLTVELAGRGHRVVAIDIAPQMIELARAAVAEAEVPTERVELACDDILERDYGGRRFDIVYALGFLQYQTDEVAALRRLGELLAPGGRLVVSGPIGRRLGNLFGLWDHVRALRRRLAALRGGTGSSELESLLAISTHTYSIGRFRRLLGAARFSPKLYRPHGFVNYALVGPLLGPGGELVLHRFFTALSGWIPIARFANDLVVLAERSDAAPSS